MRLLPDVRVRVTRGFCLGHGVDVYPGDVIELDAARARVKLLEGCVVRVADEPDGTDSERRGGKPAASPGRK